jgi:hypothetical protein
MSALPHIDTHAVKVAAPPEAVWDGIQAVLSRFGGPVARTYAHLIGCEDADRAPVGFHVADASRPDTIVLAGRHRFSNYELRLLIAPDGAGSSLSAETRAEFPGLLGRGYRLAVIGSGGHRVLTRRLLGVFKRRAERDRLR